MLWLMLLLLWSIRVIVGGPSAAAPATRVLLYLLALLAVLQLLVTILTYWSSQLQYYSAKHAVFLGDFRDGKHFPWRRSTAAREA
jgi:hypothetical protein